MMPPALRRWLALIAANLAVMLALGMAAELIFGSWLSSDPLDRLALPRGVERPVTAESLYPGGTTFIYRRDRWGFRGTGLDPTTIQVVTLGGSTTNQLYLPEAATWQSVLAEAFRLEGRTIGIANAGIDGQSTFGHIMAAEAWLPHVPGLKPRLVLAYIGVNDVHVGGNVVDRFQYSSIWKRLAQDSALIRLWNTAKGAVKARQALLNHERLDYTVATWTTEGAGATPPSLDLDAYGGRLKRLAEAIRALGAEPIFVTQARGDWRLRDGRGEGLASAPGMPNGVDQHRWLDAVNQRTLSICREVAVSCLDLGGALGFQDGDFYDLLHNTPQGARRIGLWLHQALKDHPVLSR